MSNRFKSLASMESSPTSTLPTNSRWTKDSNDNESRNPFRPSFTKREGRFSRPYSSQSRDVSPPRNSRWKRDEKEDKSDESSSFNRRSFNNDRSNYRRRSRFRPQERQSYFRKHEKKPKKPEFKLDNTDFPPLGGNIKIPVSIGPLNFNEAAQRGSQCATPPPGPGLPPVERLDRPKKVGSDDESTGWYTEDEINDRIANPSDDEDDAEFDN